MISLSDIFVVTNRTLVRNRSLSQVISSVVEGGADMIILREKDLLPAELYKMATKAMEICRGSKTKLIINSSVEVSLACDADGVHLGFGSLPIDAVRSLLPSRKIIGVSVHSPEEAETAQSMGADYLLAGHVFPTNSKAGQPGRGLEFIKNLSSQVQIPVIAIGGINIRNAKDVINAGAAGVAVMSAVMESVDIPDTISRFRLEI